MSATAMTTEIVHLPLEAQAEILATAVWMETLAGWQLQALGHFLTLYKLGLIPADDIPAAAATFERVCEQHRPADPRAGRIQ